MTSRDLLPAMTGGRTSCIQLSAVTRLFGMTPALVRVDLDVPCGEVVVVEGPNGAGKSTLLAIVATALAPTYGRGSVFGFDLDRERPKIRHRVELLGHRTGMYADLTARQNLSFWAALSGVASHEVAGALERVGLLPSADEPVRTFSQGMRQRLALARALARHADLLLLDEPYAGLDTDGKDLTDDLLRGARSEGRTVVVATHDVDRAAGIADRVVLLDRGHIVSDSRAGRLVRSS